MQHWGGRVALLPRACTEKGEGWLPALSTAAFVCLQSDNRSSPLFHHLRPVARRFTRAQIPPAALPVNGNRAAASDRHGGTQYCNSSPAALWFSAQVLHFATTCSGWRSPDSVFHQTRRQQIRTSASARRLLACNQTSTRSLRT